MAFLDGTYDAATYEGTGTSGAATAGGYHYTRSDVAQLMRQLDQLEGEVDVLLTCEWPRGVAAGEGLPSESHCPCPSAASHLLPHALSACFWVSGLEAAGEAAAPPPGVTGDTGATVIAEVAMAARPRCAGGCV